MARLSPMMLLPVAVFAGFAGLAGWALMRDDPNSVPSALIAREAPAVGTTTLPGKTQLTDEMLRQPGVKLVNFWASWCPPCRAEHPTLTELAKTMPVYGVERPRQQGPHGPPCHGVGAAGRCVRAVLHCGDDCRSRVSKPSSRVKRKRDTTTI